MEINRDLLRIICDSVVVQRIAAVVKTGPIARPRDTTEFDLLETVIGVLSGLDIANVPVPPIRAAVRDPVGDEIAIGTHLEEGKRGGSILGKGVGINEDSRLAFQ